MHRNFKSAPEKIENRADHDAFVSYLDEAYRNALSLSCAIALSKQKKGDEGDIKKYRALLKENLTDAFSIYPDDVALLALIEASGFRKEDLSLYPEN